MAEIELNATEIAFWTLIIGSAGALFGRYWDTRTHFRNKRDEMREFLGRWNQEIYRVTARDMGNTRLAYLNREGEFSGHVAKLAPHFWRKAKFVELCDPLLEIRDEDFQTGDADCRDVVAEPIKRLLAWL